MALHTKARITNREELRRRIHFLTEELEKKEQQMKTDVKEVHESLQIKNMVRNVFEEFRENSEMRAGVMEAALDAGVNVLIDKLVMRKKHSVKNYLISAALRRLAAFYISKRAKLMQEKQGMP